MSPNRSTRPLAFAFAILAAAVVSVAATSARSDAHSAVAAPVTQLGPFVSMQTAFDSTSGNAVGGVVRYYINACSTDTLKIGQAVYLSANNGVCTSTTGSNHEKAVGIVVGGRSTNMIPKDASADVGTAAALPSRPVIVLRTGRMWVMNDAADTVRAGDRCKPSTNTAGKIMGASATLTATGANPTQATTTIAYANADTIRSGATAVTSSAANGAIIGHSAATITNGAITVGAVTVAGDGMTKIFCTVVKKANPSATALAEINAR